MKFIKWYFRNSWFHLLVLIGGITFMHTWDSGIDKTIGLSFFGLVLAILTFGKIHYYKNNIKKYE